MILIDLPGTPVADEDLARASLLLHGYVIPNGTYHFPGAVEEATYRDYPTVSFRRGADIGPSVRFLFDSFRPPFEIGRQPP